MPLNFIENAFFSGNPIKSRGRPTPLLHRHTDLSIASIGAHDWLPNTYQTVLEYALLFLPIYS